MLSRHSGHDAMGSILQIRYAARAAAAAAAATLSSVDEKEQLHNTSELLCTQLSLIDVVFNFDPNLGIKCLVVVHCTNSRE